MQSVKNINMGKKIIRLYDIPKGSRIKAVTTNDDGEKLGDFIIFDHVDGMYSYCTIEGKEDLVCHLSAVQQLDKVGDYYEMV